MLDALHDWLTAQRRRLSIEERAGQGDPIRAEPLGCADPLHRRRPARIDNNRRRASAARHRRHPQELPVPRLRGGGERAAILYTLLESAKLNGLDPEAYLADVIDRMAKGHPINRLDELLPWNWQRQPAKLAA